MATRAEAQARIDQIQSFQREVRQLSAAGVLRLSEGQLQSIQSHHEALVHSLRQQFDVDQDARTKQMSLGMRVASFLGALSLAASVFFFFYKVWGRFDTSGQLVLLLAAPIASLCLTAWLRARDTTGYFVKLAAMVCFACFVLDLSMLGQVFNITPSDKALLAWAAMGAILAYGTDTRLLLVAALICAVSFVAARFGTWAGTYWIDFGERPENFFPAALALLLVPRLIGQGRYDGFAGTYRIVGLLTFFGPLLVLSNWGEGSYLQLDPTLIQRGYQVIGFVASAGAIAWGIRRGVSDVVNTSVTFFVVLLFTKFYDWWWEIMPKYLFFLVIGLTAILFLLVLRRMRSASFAHVSGAVL